MLKMINDCNNSKNFWKTINKFKPKITKKNPIELGDWKTHFERLFPPRENINVIMSDARHPILDITIMHEEIVTSIKQAKPGKSPGPDGLNNEFFKNSQITGSYT